MQAAEAVLSVAAFALPLLFGFAAGYKGRPWWWAALAAVAVVWLAAIVPTPEPGEPRVSGGDIGFLVIVAVFVAGLTWLGAFIGRRMAVRSARPGR